MAPHRNAETDVPQRAPQPAGDAREDVIIRVESLTARFGTVTVFDSIGFEVKRGEIFVILGGSGSGKSTLLKHMIGLYEPASGRIEIEGEDIVTAQGAARRAILRRFGVMYQSGALFGSSTLLENVRLPLEELTNLPLEAMDRIAASKLRMVGLGHAEASLPAEVSGGMKKRAAIARALALDPELVFLDEPSAGLDPITSVELDDTLLFLRDALGVTFVVVTHELESLFKIADRVLMIDHERKNIAAIGKPEALRDGCEIEWVRRFFRRESGREAA